MVYQQETRGFGDRDELLLRETALVITEHPQLMVAMFTNAVPGGVPAGMWNTLDASIRSTLPIDLRPERILLKVFASGEHPAPSRSARDVLSRFTG